MAPDAMLRAAEDPVDRLGRVLITGASGFIGSHLLEYLAERGASITCVRHTTRIAVSVPAAVVVTADVSDANEMRRATEGVSTVFHLGGISAVSTAGNSPLEAFRVNTVGTENILEAARVNGCRVVLLSTAHVFGPPLRLPITEDHPVAPASIYAGTKLAADVLAMTYSRSFGIPVTVLRPFNVYGPRQGTIALIPTIVAQAIAGGPVHVRDLRPRRDFIFVDDVVFGLVRAAVTPSAAGQEIILASGQAISVAALVREIMTLTSGVETHTPEEPDDTGDYTYGHAAKAQALLGWEPRIDLKTGLARTIAWWRQQTPIRNHA